MSDEKSSKGKLEQNLAGTVAGENRVGDRPSDTAHAEEGTWKDAPEGTPATKERDALESMNTGAESVTAKDNVDLLAELFSNFGEAEKTDKALVSSHFENGKPGTYLTRAKTLTEKTRGLLPR